eukprot:6460069-Amphidinium_carterae.1
MPAVLSSTIAEDIILSATAHAHCVGFMTADTPTTWLDLDAHRLFQRSLLPTLDTDALVR